MKKKLLLLLTAIVTVPVFAQQIEHGTLVGVGVGFSLQDDPKNISFKSKEEAYKEGYYIYDNNIKSNGLLGYRFRIKPEQKRTFYDIDMTVGLQWMQTKKYRSVPMFLINGDVNPEFDKAWKDRKTIKQFYMPVSVTGSWNYSFSDKLFMGIGLSPTLYVSPNVAFDLSIMPRIGYKISKRCELDLTFQYGSLDVMKRFNEGNSKGRRGHLSDLMFSVYVPLSKK